MRYLRRPSAKELGSSPLPHPRVSVPRLVRKEFGVLRHHDALFEGLNLAVWIAIRKVGSLITKKNTIRGYSSYPDLYWKAKWTIIVIR